jgi:hypothetical protein
LTLKKNRAKINQNYDEESSIAFLLKRAVVGGNTAQNLYEKHFGVCGRKHFVIRTARLSRKDIIKVD